VDATLTHCVEVTRTWLRKEAPGATDPKRVSSLHGRNGAENRASFRRGTDKADTAAAPLAAADPSLGRMSTVLPFKAPFAPV